MVNQFSWLFTTWLECMHECAPNAIITNQDRPMKNAIEKLTIDGVCGI